MLIRILSPACVSTLLVISLSNAPLLAQPALGQEPPQPISEQDASPTDSLLPIPNQEAVSVLPMCPTDEELRQSIKPIAQIAATMKADPKLTQDAGSPLDCSYHVFQGKVQPRAMTAVLTEVNWRPTDFFHQPLYFDDQPLERYGQSLCPELQPIISGGRFFFTLPIIPYKMGLDRTHDCISTLAYERPGKCLPCFREKLVPAFELDAALLQAGTAVALVFLLP